MNRRAKSEKSVARSASALTVGRLVAAEAIFTAVLILVLVGGQWICTRFFVWQGDELIYRIGTRLSNNMFLTLIAFWILGTIAVILVHEHRLAQYFQILTDAADDLVADDGEDIRLPSALHEAEVRLNLIKLESERNARAAKDAEQRKNDLVVYLAHDLKTPLTSVIGYLSLLREETDISPELRDKYTGIALDKAERLEDLINEFFEITRFNLSHMELETEDVSLTRMLEQTASEFEPVLAEKGLNWQLNIAPDLRLVCDPDKLERVFDNLIRNAVNYSYRDTVITLYATDLGGRVGVKVQNRGKTIPPEKLSRIFDQFYRVDTSRASETGGSGLGLAIAKEIVSLHGGTISAESRDETVVFTVILPKAGPAPS